MKEIPEVFRLGPILLACFIPQLLTSATLSPPLNTWVKISPLPDAPPSPRLGYEGACVWDAHHQRLIRYGGHNQGGGGEQGSELWTFDPSSAQWALQEPNTSPPGVCCNAQNVFDSSRGVYLRFPSFSGNHGWQWWREIYLNDSTVWTYSLKTGLWLNRRPLPAPQVAGLRCASWDTHHEVVLLFGGEGSHEGTLTYDPHLNEWKWMKPALQPDFRSGGQMAYDSARRVHVLFGSQFTDDPHTWIYDLSANEWRDARPERMPATDQNDAVLAYDAGNQVVLALIKLTTGQEDQARHRLETWAYDTGANTWTKMDPAREPDPTGNRARQLVFAPELNLALLENRPHPPQGPAEQQIWIYRYGETTAPTFPAPAPLGQRPSPPIVEQAVVSVISTREVQLRWEPPTEEVVTGYHVERAEVEVLTEDQLQRLKSNTPPLAEPSVGAFRRIGAFQRLTHTPCATRSFTDTELDLSRPEVVTGALVYERPFHEETCDPRGRPYRFAVYAYRIRSVNAAGRESGPSPAFFTIPSSPQWLFSREDGTTCHLKWAANLESGLRGYRIYRMDGRWDQDPILRVTDNPIPATRYEDATAGPDTRRYYVVAVDGLGQEGFPSAPVWFQREWARFYEPFTGTWHQ